MINHLAAKTMARVIEEVGLGVTIVSSSGKVRWANSRAIELLGWQERSAQNSVMDCHPQRSWSRVQAKLTHDQVTEWHKLLTIKGRSIENQYFPVDLDGERGMLIVSRDVTEREATARALQKAAVTDGLTGLLNRQRLNNIIDGNEETQGLIGAIVADINGLKVVNDKHGHHAGDQLIVQTAELLRQSAGPNDLVFRIGGDEFLILVYGEHEEALVQIVERIGRGSDCSNYGLLGQVCVSVGASLVADHVNLEAAISVADGRMYQAKRSFYEAAATKPVS